MILKYTVSNSMRPDLCLRTGFSDSGVTVECGLRTEACRRGDYEALIRERGIKKPLGIRGFSYSGGDGGSVTRHPKSLKRLAFSYNGVARAYHKWGSNGRTNSPRARSKTVLFLANDAHERALRNRCLYHCPLGQVPVHATEQLASTFPSAFSLSIGAFASLDTCPFLSGKTSPRSLRGKRIDAIF
jgi:hypothetical protein